MTNTNRLKTQKYYRKKYYCDMLNLGSEKRSREVREETVLDNFRSLYWMPPGPFIHELNNKQC